MESDPFVALKLFLRRDFDGYEEMIAGVADKELARALGAVFFVVMDEKFNEASVADVIRFVANARALFDETGDKVDPSVAERLVRAAALGEEHLARGVDQTMLGRAETILLAALAEQESWPPEDVDGFIAEAREVAAG